MAGIPTRGRAGGKAFATTLALALLALVGLSIAAMASLFAAEARRTRVAAASAQLRQLLLAGSAEAQRRLAAWDGKPAEITVALPPSLTGDGASLRIAIAPVDADAAARIDATAGERRLTQEVRLTRRSGQWRISSLTLPE